MEMKERILAIVLLDLIGSTAFVQRVGPMRAAHWLQYHDRLTRSLLYKFNGREIDRSDGFMLSFERVVDAVNFALHYQAQIPAKTKLNTRIGIHWGPIIEVTQDEAYVLANAKSVELEGVSKNIAARTMSVCQAGQVLLTKEAFRVIRGRTNHYTPKDTRYACIGLYGFKGVAEPQVLYAVGQTIESLQPPPSSEKAKRLGGNRKIKSRLRDKKLKEWLWFILTRWAFINVVCLMARMWPFLSQPEMLELYDIYPYFFWVVWLDQAAKYIITFL